MLQCIVALPPQLPQLPQHTAPKPQTTPPRPRRAHPSLLLFLCVAAASLASIAALSTRSSPSARMPAAGTGTPALRSHPKPQTTPPRPRRTPILGCVQTLASYSIVITARGLSPREKKPGCYRSSDVAPRPRDRGRAQYRRLVGQSAVGPSSLSPSLAPLALDSSRAQRAQSLPHPRSQLSGPTPARTSRAPLLVMPRSSHWTQRRAQPLAAPPAPPHRPAAPPLAPRARTARSRRRLARTPSPGSAPPPCA
jgi:hypothetical protein